MSNYDRVFPRLAPVYHHCYWMNTTGSGDWNDPRNWKDGRVPRKGDVAMFVLNDGSDLDKSTIPKNR